MAIDGLSFAIPRAKVVRRPSIKELWRAHLIMYAGAKRHSELYLDPHQVPTMRSRHTGFWLLPISLTVNTRRRWLKWTPSSHLGRLMLMPWATVLLSL